MLVSSISKHFFCTFFKSQTAALTRSLTCFYGSCLFWNAFLKWLNKFVNSITATSQRQRLEGIMENTLYSIQMWLQELVKISTSTGGLNIHKWLPHDLYGTETKSKKMWYSTLPQRLFSLRNTTFTNQIKYINIPRVIWCSIDDTSVTGGECTAEWSTLTHRWNTVIPSHCPLWSSSTASLHYADEW